MLDLLPLATLTRLDLMAIVATGVLVLCVPVLLYLIGEDQRDQRQHQRNLEVHRAKEAVHRAGIELAESRTAAHEARAMATAAHDEDYAASVRAERDEANRLAVKMLHQKDQLEAELHKARGELAAARQYVHRVNRSQLQTLARHLEAEQTLQLPVARPTVELPRLPPGPRRILQETPS